MRHARGGHRCNRERTTNGSSFAFSGLAAALVGTGAAVALGSTSSAASNVAMGDAEMKHTQETKKVGALSLATSRVAVTTAADGKVKYFAQLEVAEQETIADILQPKLRPMLRSTMRGRRC